MTDINESTVFDSIVNECVSMQEQAITSMTGGHCLSYDDYRYHCGIIYAVKMLREHVKDLEKKFLEE